MINLKANPFFLDDEGVKWVQDTLAGMTTEEKVGQLFCPMGYASDKESLNHMLNELHIGAMMYRPGPKEDIRNTHKAIQDAAKIPLLLAANTEGGGDGLCVEGTSFGRPMAVAATGDAENAYRMGYVACKEGASVGLNWSFAPIIDIDYNFHNPITNLRTFGSDPEMVKKCGSAYLRGADEAGVAVSIKHFPGDGCDERDQHLVTSINDKSAEEWDKTYGYVYKSLIDQGAKTVMVGHIAQPAKVAAINPNATAREKLLPASLNKYLLTDVLRGELGFNGLITTDASVMIGFMSAMPRVEAVPYAIMAGNDMFLFNKSIDEDYQLMLAGVNTGKLTMERLNEAVTRILATKASLKLHIKQKEGTLVPEAAESDAIVGCKQHKDWAKEVADKAITLVKDTQHLLPISPAKYKRVYLNVITKNPEGITPLVEKWKAIFEKEGFEVAVRDRSVSIEPMNFAGIGMTPEKGALLGEMYRPTAAFAADKDLYVYIVNVENASNNTVARINWNVMFGLGDDAPWFVEENVPCLMISTANPYHLYDAPMVKTFINSYNDNPVFNEALMDKLMGRSEFKGVAPSDPFCGNDNLRLTAEF
ncbi:MAG: hypothetical protein MJ178_07445 [Treponemataceae bacterium]|nr:hypothetical protein [Treponemataceae bacterium]